MLFDSLRYLSGFIIHIDKIILGLFFIGILLLYTEKFFFLGRKIFSLITLIFIGLCVVPTSQWVATYLENRFPQIQKVPQDVVGMIFLGGGFDSETSGERGITCYNIAAGRVIATLELVKQHPHLKVAFTGGGARTNNARSEAEMMKNLFESVGINPHSFIFENLSKNTIENAKFLHGMVKPKTGEKWLLVTSALHMPRAVGLFRKEGWDIVPYPVDYHTLGGYPSKPNFGLSGGFQAWAYVSKEIIAMATNYLLGYSDEFIASPRENTH